MSKDFDKWNEIKKKTENKGRPSVKTGDIFWCRLGLNIDTEMDGKNENFLRPVLIIKKFSDETVSIIPLTSQKHKGDWYFNFEFNNKIQYVILNQARTIDTRRLEDRMGEVSKNILSQILDLYFELLKKE